MSKEQSLKKSSLYWIRYVLLFILSLIIILIFNHIPLDIPTGSSPKMINAYLILPIPYIEFFLMLGGLTAKNQIGKIIFILQLIFLSILILLVLATIDWKIIFN